MLRCLDAFFLFAAKEYAALKKQTNPATAAETTTEVSPSSCLLQGDSRVVGTFPILLRNDVAEEGAGVGNADLVLFLHVSYRVLEMSLRCGCSRSRRS